MKKILTLLLISNSLFSQTKLPAKIEAESFSSTRYTTLNTDTAADNMGGK